MALSDLTPADLGCETANSKYSYDQKMQAIILSCNGETSFAVGKIIDVPPGVIRQWKRTDWWADAVDEFMVDQRDKKLRKFMELGDLALDQAIDGVKNGTIKVNPKTGMEYTEKVSAKDAATIAAIANDKEVMIRNMSSGQDKKDSITLEKMARQMEDLYNKANAKQIEGTVITEENE